MDDRVANRDRSSSTWRGKPVPDLAGSPKSQEGRLFLEGKEITMAWINTDKIIVTRIWCEWCKLGVCSWVFKFNRQFLNFLEHFWSFTQIEFFGTKDCLICNFVKISGRWWEKWQIKWWRKIRTNYRISQSLVTMFVFPAKFPPSLFPKTTPPFW